MLGINLECSAAPANADQPTRLVLRPLPIRLRTYAAPNVSSRINISELMPMTPPRCGQPAT